MKYDPDHMAALIRERRGIVSDVARALQCSRTTIYEYRDRHPVVAEALGDSREEVTDLAESALLALVLNRDHPDHFRAVQFYLRTVGKMRGYTERQEITGADGAPTEVIFAFTDAASNAQS